MTQVLLEALTKRGRVWGQQNAAILHALRDDKLPTRRWPIRPCLSLSFGAYLTRIPGAP